MKAKKKLIAAMSKWLAVMLVVCTVTFSGGYIVHADDTFGITLHRTTSTYGVNQNAGGSLSVSSSPASPGTVVTVTAAPNTGYYLAQVRYSYTDAGSNEVYNTVTPVGGVYSFTMPSSNVDVYADFVSIKWDGTIDVTWYNPSATTYNIQYAAQLAGVAAITNGIFNNYPTAVNSSSNKVPDVNTNGTPFGSNAEYYNTYGDGSSMSNTTNVVGNISYIQAANSTGITGENNQVTASAYWFGGTKSGSTLYPTDFTGKTINLTADVDMGGVLAAGTSEFALANWSGPNYMPIGGQYLIYNSNGYTHLGSSFNGTFDGQGHIVDKIYCDRYAATSFGDGESVGLIGRLGVHDNDPSGWYANPVVKNVAVDGIIYSRRSVGGIVGKTGQSQGAVIENCMNFATVQNTDTKGIGGIVGAGWNDTTIENCANYGYIYTTSKNAGGISGSCEAQVINSYNLGYVGASSIEQAQALGTNNGGAVWENCYWLSGSSSAVVNPAVYGSKVGSTITMISAANDYKGSTFLSNINNGGSSWMTSTSSNVSAGVANALQSVHSLSSSLSAYDCLGIAVPSTF